MTYLLLPLRGVYATTKFACYHALMLTGFAAHVAWKFAKFMGFVFLLLILDF